jgi:hypothetical protein
MKRILALFLLASVALWGVACGGVDSTGVDSSATDTVATPIIATAANPTADPLPATDEAGDAPAEATAGCEDFFRFCVTSTISGAVDATATAGMGGQVDDCVAWVAAGEPRILEMPMMQAAGEARITHALTRIAAYTGPGSYELKAVATEGIPDMFPTIEAAGRVFSYGEGSTAVVTVAADGSGSIEANGLVEIASMQVSAPDPTARVDFSMQWTCREN